MKNVLLFILFLVLFISANVKISEAQISVDNVMVHLAIGSRPVHNVIVSNTSNETAYVITEVKSVPDPTNDKIENITTTDLLASPKAFSIEPHGQRTVRLLLKAPPGEKEKVFRVGFIPQDRGFGQNVVQNLDGRKTVIRVLSGMGILVFADPVKPLVDLKWIREGGKITLTNSGTVNVHLTEVKSCSGPEICNSLETKRLYSGASYVLNVPPENTVSFEQEVIATGENQKVTIAPKG
jgi:P pilus assembly chaperone PapD